MAPAAQLCNAALWTSLPSQTTMEGTAELIRITETRSKLAPGKDRDQRPISTRPRLSVVVSIGWQTTGVCVSFGYRSRVTYNWNPDSRTRTEQKGGRGRVDGPGREGRLQVI